MKTILILATLAALLCGCAGYRAAYAQVEAEQRARKTREENRSQVGCGLEIRDYLITDRYERFSGLFSNGVAIATNTGPALLNPLREQAYEYCRRIKWAERNNDAPAELIRDGLNGKVALSYADYVASRKMTEQHAFAFSQVGEDTFKKFRFVTGPPVLLGRAGSCYLSAEKRETELQPRYFVTISTHGSEWALWKEIVDESGQTFPLRSDDNKVISGSNVRETSYALVPETNVRAWSTNETKFRIYGKRSEDFSLPYKSVAGFLRKCDETFAPALSAK